MAVVGDRRIWLAPAPALAVVRRELLSTLRGIPAFAFLTLFVVAGLTYAWYRWPSGVSGLTEAAQASRGLMQLFIWILFGACLLLVPAFGASAIVIERERSTLDFLKLSLIRPSGIIAAKLLNTVGYFLILIIGIVPVMSIAFFLIGVDTTELFHALALILSTAFACAAVGLVSSAMFRRSFVAIGMSYLGVMMLFVLAPIAAYIFGAAMFFLGNVASVFGRVATVGAVASPPRTLYLLLSDSLLPGQLTLALAWQGIFTLLCLALALYLVRRPANPVKVEDGKPVDTAEELRRRMTSFPFYIIDPLRRKKAIEDGRNPMLVREMRWGLMNRGTTLIRAFYMSFVVYFFAGAVASIDARSYQTMGTWLLMQIVLTVLVAPALLANALTKEYELGNLDMLRMTLLRPRDIIVGKLAAGMGSITPIFIAAVLSCIPVLILGASSYLMLAMGYGTLAVCMLLCLSVGLLASLLTRRTSIALVISYVLALIVFAGLYVPARIYESTQFAPAVTLRQFAPQTKPLAAHREFQQVHRAVHLLSPIATFVAATPYRAGQALPVGVEVDTQYWLFGMVLWLAIAVGIIAVSIRVFRRYKMRDP